MFITYNEADERDRSEIGAEDEAAAKTGVQQDLEENNSCPRTAAFLLVQNRHRVGFTVHRP